MGVFLCIVLRIRVELLPEIQIIETSFCIVFISFLLLLADRAELVHRLLSLGFLVKGRIVTRVIV